MHKYNHPDSYKIWRTALYVTLQLNNQIELIHNLTTILGEGYRAVETTESEHDGFKPNFDMDQDIAAAIAMAAQMGKVEAIKLLCDRYLGLAKPRHEVEQNALEIMQNNGFSEQALILKNYFASRPQIDLFI